jgi:uncharacterized protein (DUF3820 family)
MLRIYDYIKELRKRTLELERKDINNHVAVSFFAKNQRRILCAIPSLLLLWYLKNGFPENFVDYMSNALSILIGLFSTAIIFSFDKFYEKKDLSKASSTEKVIDKQSYNYTKQFVHITGYSIILCVFALVFLSFSSLFSSLTNINIFDYYFDLHGSIWISILIPLVLVQRFLILYWLSNIVYNTLFVISSLVKYMTLKMDR